MTKGISMGGKLLTGLTKAEKALKAAKAKGKVKSVAKLEESIAKSNKQMDKLATAGGFSITGGAQGYEQGADEVEGIIRGADDQVLLDSDPYLRDLYKSYLTQEEPYEAWKKAKEDYVDVKRKEVGGKTALIMGVTSGALSPMFGKMLTGELSSTVAGGAAKGVATEATEEFVQEFSTASVVKESLPMATDINPLDRGLVGAAAGGITGGVIGAASTR